MDLYFLRHGKAEAAEDWTGAERERPLTDKGRDAFRAAARGLRWLDPKLDALYTSPLARARETAEMAGAALGVPVTEIETLAPGFDLDDLATLLRERSGASALLFTGHEPDLSTIVGLLIGSAGGACVTMKPGACCRVDVPTEHQGAISTDTLSGSGCLMWLMTTKHLGRLAP